MIYFIQGEQTRRIKIGVSKDDHTLRARFTILQASIRRIFSLRDGVMGTPDRSLTIPRPVLEEFLREKMSLKPIIIRRPENPSLAC
jgi:hypothetical protein